MKTYYLLSVFFIFSFSSIYSQSLYMKDFYDGKKTINFSVERAYSSGITLGTLNGFYKLNYIHPISKSLSLEAMVSYHNNSFDNTFYETKSGIGNIYLGINKLSESGNVNYSLGLYLPTRSDDVPLNPGSNYCGYEVGDVFANGFLLKGNYLFQKKNSSGLILAFEAGPDIFIRTDEGNVDRVVGFLHCAGKIGYEFNNFTVFGEISNLLNVTSKIDKIKDRFSNSYGLSGSYTFTNFKLGLSYKNSFDEYLNSYDGNIGLNFSFFGF